MKPSLSNCEFYRKLWNDMRLHWRMYVVLLPVVFFVSCAYALGKIDLYQCSIKIVPEQGASSGSNRFVKLAKLFGANLSKNISDEGLYPNLYPDLMKSVEFKTKLLSIQIRLDSGKIISYHDYLVNYQKLPWWNILFSDNEKSDVEPINPQALTLSQFYLMKIVGGKVKCEIDEKTTVITISVKDQNPVVAASVADSVCLILQTFITNYHSSKARIDYDYYVSDKYISVIQRYFMTSDDMVGDKYENVYVISLENGKRIDNSEIRKIYKMSEDDIYEKIENKLKGNDVDY